MGLLIHPITRHHLHCEQCGLPSLTCLCDQLVPVTTQAQFLLLTCHKERLRASNTGRLLKQLTPQGTEIVLWERKQPEADWIKRLQQHPNAYLVFPEAPDTVHRARPFSGAKPLFVLLDGTWQEARKMARKSPYLDTLPRLSLSPQLGSRYSLRAGHPPGALCTIEAAAACLQLAQEPANADHLLQSFELFLQHYQAGLSGHAVKAAKAHFMLQ